MRSEAFASPDHDADDKRQSDDKRAEVKGVRVLPVESFIAEAPDLSRDVSANRTSVFPSEGPELAKVAPFPTEVESTPATPATPAHRAAAAVTAADTVSTREAVAADAPARPTTRNWRNIVLAVLGVAVVAQGALMAYWMVSSGGFAALTTQTGSISLTSEPAASPVTIDGEARGQTPLTIALSPGAHSVVVGTGAQARTQSVNVVRGSNASLHVQLPPVVAAPAAAATTALQIASEPVGARVWVDGEARGVAPITVSNLTGGNHTVTVRGNSGDPITRTVTVQEGTTASLIITMPGAGSFASGFLSIQSPLSLQVMEKGALLGTTDMPRIMLAAGSHDLEFVNTALGFRTTRSMTIAAGQTASFSVIPPRGTLSINALPWAEVFIDGTRVGETPIGNYSIPIGNHEVLFRHPDFGERRRTVTVGAQGPVRVGVDMKNP